MRCVKARLEYMEKTQEVGITNITFPLLTSGKEYFNVRPVSCDLGLAIGLIYHVNGFFLMVSVSEVKPVHYRRLLAFGEP